MSTGTGAQYYYLLRDLILIRLAHDKIISCLNIIFLRWKKVSGHSSKPVINIKYCVAWLSLLQRVDVGREVCLITTCPCTSVNQHDGFGSRSISSCRKINVHLLL